MCFSQRGSSSLAAKSNYPKTAEDLGGWVLLDTCSLARKLALAPRISRFLFGFRAGSNPKLKRQPDFRYPDSKPRAGGDWVCRKPLPIEGRRRSALKARRAPSGNSWEAGGGNLRHFRGLLCTLRLGAGSPFQPILSLGGRQRLTKGLIYVAR